MTVETAREVSTNPEVLKRLAKNLAQQCFRHTMLEDLHARVTPNSLPSLMLVCFLSVRQPGTTPMSRHTISPWSASECDVTAQYKQLPK